MHILYIHVYTYTCIHIYIHVFIYTCIYIYIYIYICICIFSKKLTYVHIYTHIYINQFYPYSVLHSNSVPHIHKSVLF